MKPIRILLADDHTIIRDGVKTMLKKNPEIEVVYEVGDGEEMIQYLDNNHENIDIVLTDITMPKMDGIEATQIILERFPNLKVLALTMHEEESFITEMIKVGVHGYILKNSNTDELIKAINTIYNNQKYFSPQVSSTMIDSMMNKNESLESELSKREIEVLGFIADGNTNKQAGEKMFLSPRTIETHRRNIMDKLDLRNTAEIVKYAIKNNYVN
jgi:two-component system, NarL family, response regulator NreC